MRSQLTGRTLYICYFGLREPLVQSQVLPYLRELAARGLGVHLLTFEPRAWPAADAFSQTDRLRVSGIEWHRVPYHKGFHGPATLLDIVAGAAVVARLAKRNNIRILHARSHVPLAISLLVRRVTRSRLIFDLRGLAAEEYADAGIWRSGSAGFRFLKAVEHRGMRVADQVVVLTERMRDWILEQDRVAPDRMEVIPCCVDVSRFDCSGLGPPSTRRRLVYAGSVSGVYLLEEMAAFFGVVRGIRPGLQLRVLTTASASRTASRLRASGLSPSEYTVGAASQEDLPGLLCTSSVGLSFRRPGLAQIAASPTKVAEYLAAGLPVVSSAGVGDLGRILPEFNVGVEVKRFHVEEYRAIGSALVRMLDDAALGGRCRATARQLFDLRAVGGPRYQRVYEKLTRPAG